MAAMCALVIAHLLVLLPLLQAAVELELHGNIYPDGHLYVAMRVGEPAKTYFLMIDTGSPLTWLECDYPCQSPHTGPHDIYRPEPSNKVTCEDDRCVVLHRDMRVMHDCTRDPNECDYKISYLEASSSKGVLLADKFSLPTTNDNSPNLVFGCGYDQTSGPDQPIPVDGVLGLSVFSTVGTTTQVETNGFVSQLKQHEIIDENVFGHCIGTNGGGFLFFGGGSNRVPTSGVTWLPIASGIGIYSPGAAALDLNVLQEYQVSLEAMRTAFDSGSTYTYVHTITYTRLIHALGITLEGSSLTKVSDHSLPQAQCWKDTEPIPSVDDIKNKFHPLDLIFSQGDNQVTLQIPPENYIVVTKNGNVCLGILDGGHQVPMNIIGGGKYSQTFPLRKLGSHAFFLMINYPIGWFLLCN